jgi:hypothetical protein
MLPSEDVLKHWELLISIISGILTLASGFVKIRFLRYVFGAIFFFSLGFYLSFLHYERNWVLTDNVRGRLYDFKDKQSCVPESPQHPSTKVWCQWMMDHYDAGTVRNMSKKLLVFEQFLPVGDFLFQGNDQARLGFLGTDRPHQEEPGGRLALVIFDYESPRFPRDSKAVLRLTAHRGVQAIPPSILIRLNNHRVAISTLNESSTTYSIDLEPGYVHQGNNFIYLEPGPDYASHGETKLLYVDSIQIETP